MFREQRFQADMRNVVVFTVLFLLLAVVGGLVMALLVHHVTVGKGLFRSVFLLPYALSFIVTGVAFRWIFNPEQRHQRVAGAIFGIDNPPGWTTAPPSPWPYTGPTAKGSSRSTSGSRSR